MNMKICSVCMILHFFLDSHNTCSRCDGNADCVKGNCVCQTGYVGNGRVCEGKIKGQLQIFLRFAEPLNLDLM